MTEQPELPEVRGRTLDRIHMNLQRRVSLRYVLIKDAVEQLPQDDHAETRFDEFVREYTLPARIANILRSTLSTLAVVVELAAPVVVFTVLRAIGATTVESLACGFCSALALALLAHCRVTRASRAWHWRIWWLTVLTVLASVLPLTTLGSDMGVVARPEWLGIPLLSQWRDGTLSFGSTAIAVSAAGALLAALIAHILREARCRVLTSLMVRSPREQMVCEMVQAIDLIQVRESARNGDRKRQQRVVAELLDSVVHLYGRERLVATLKLSRQSSRETRKDLQFRERQVTRLRDNVQKSRSQRVACVQELSCLAAGLLTEQDDVTAVESAPSRLMVGLQVVGMVLAVAGLAVAVVLLGQVVGPAIGMIITAVAGGLVTTFAPALTSRMGMDLSWLPRLFKHGDAGGDQDPPKPEEAEGS